MSWSFYAMGRGDAVVRKAAAEFALNPCAEPEEAIRQHVGDFVKAVCESGPDLDFVIEATGSMSTDYREPPKVTYHSLVFTLRVVQLAE